VTTLVSYNRALLEIPGRMPFTRSFRCVLFVQAMAGAGLRAHAGRDRSRHWPVRAGLIQRAPDIGAGVWRKWLGQGVATAGGAAVEGGYRKPDYAPFVWSSYFPPSNLKWAWRRL
jgi:hypothetical protein